MAASLTTKTSLPSWNLQFQNPSLPCIVLISYNHHPTPLSHPSGLFLGRPWFSGKEGQGLSARGLGTKSSGLIFL